MSRRQPPSTRRRDATKSARLRENLDHLDEAAHARLMVRNGYAPTETGFERDGLQHPNLVQSLTTDTEELLNERRGNGEWKSRANGVEFLGRTTAPPKLKAAR